MGNKPGVQARADAFKHIFDTNLTLNQENRANHLREAYRIGQRLFRSVLEAGRNPDSAELSSYLDDFGSDDASKEGFLMGWQSDAYAHKHGLELSVEGITRIVLDEKDMEKSHEYFGEAEADSVLYGPGVDG